MTEQPYHYTRHRWIYSLDLESVFEDLKALFKIEILHPPSDNLEISFFKHDRERLKVKGDTLIVRLSPFRAVLYQKEPAPFTEKDMELKKKIFELYPQSKIIPFKVARKEPKIPISKRATVKAKTKSKAKDR